VLLVRNHSVLPHIKVAQSTNDMDWNNVELRVFSTDAANVTGLFTRPDGGIQTLSLVPHGRTFTLREDPQAGKVKWTITR
jgi:alpha-D-xyloside xylohydrolase